MTEPAADPTPTPTSTGQDAIEVVSSDADSATLRIPKHLLVQLEWACDAAQEVRAGGNPSRPDRLEQCDALPTLSAALSNAWWDCHLQTLVERAEARAEFRESLERIARDNPEYRDELAVTLTKLAELEAEIEAGEGEEAEGEEDGETVAPPDYSDTDEAKQG